MVEEGHIPWMDRPGEGEKVSSGVRYGVRRVPSGSPPGLSPFAPSDLSDLSDKTARLRSPLSENNLLPVLVITKPGNSDH